MFRFRSVVIALCALAILVGSIGSAEARHRKGRKGMRRAMWDRGPYYICVTNECTIMSPTDKRSPGRIDNLETIEVVWCNRSDRVVVIEFDDLRLVGRRSIRLNPREAYKTVFRSNLVDGKGYGYRVVCVKPGGDGEDGDENDGEVYGPTPELGDEKP